MLKEIKEKEKFKIALSQFILDNCKNGDEDYFEKLLLALEEITKQLTSFR